VLPNGLGRVDEQVQEHLVDLLAVGHRRGEQIVVGLTLDLSRRAVQQFLVAAVAHEIPAAGVLQADHRRGQVENRLQTCLGAVVGFFGALFEDQGGESVGHRLQERQFPRVVGMARCHVQAEHPAGAS